MSCLTWAVPRTPSAVLALLAPVIVLADVEPTVLTYATHDGVPLSMHIARPEGESDAPHTAAVIVHGGGWDMGDPTWCYKTMERFVDAGFVAIAPQYRLSSASDSSTTPLDAMKDIRAAFRWVRVRADSLDIRPDHLIGYGWSAGAHLIACAAVFRDADGDVGVSCMPDVMVLSSPAVSLHRDAWVTRILHGAATPEDISPDTHVVAGMPPTLLLQGRTDTVTPLSGTQAFHDAMVARGNACKLVVYDGVGHLFTPSSEPDDAWPHPDPDVSQRAWAETLAFLEHHGS